MCDIKKFLVVEVLTCLAQNIMLMNVEFREVVCYCGRSNQMLYEWFVCLVLAGG